MQTPSKELAKFKHQVEITIIEPDIEPLMSLRLLDFNRLKKGKHQIEVGFLKGACCSQPIRAVVENGLVKGFEVTPCRDSKKTSIKEIGDLFTLAAKKVSNAKPWMPMPIEEFVTKVEARAINMGTGAGCFWICIFNRCLFCCEPGATSPSSPSPTCWIETRQEDLVLL
jgi:hypothetical protein